MPPRGRFLLDVSGAFRCRDVSVAWTRRRRRRTARIDRLIVAIWRKAVARARRTGQELYDGKLCRLVGYAVRGRRLHLTVGATRYREFLGTNVARGPGARSGGPGVLANPLGVSVVVVSSDGFVVLGRRSRRTVLHPKRIHPIGGMVEYRTAGRCPDVFDVALAELREELGVPLRRGSIVCLGLVRDARLLQPELIFRVHVAQTARVIRAAARGAEHAHEHHELVTVADRPDAVATFLRRRRGEITTIGVAALALHGLDRWGRSWFAPVAAGALSPSR